MALVNVLTGCSLWILDWGWKCMATQRWDTLCKRRSCYNVDFRLARLGLVGDFVHLHLDRVRVQFDDSAVKRWDVACGCMMLIMRCTSLTSNAAQPNDAEWGRNNTSDDSALLVVIVHQFRVSLVVKRNYKLGVCLGIGL